MIATVAMRPASAPAPLARPQPTDDGGAFTFGLWFIALPCLLFLVSFVRPWLGLPLACAIAALSWFLRGRLTAGPASTGWIAAAVAGGLALLVGIPTGHSAWDWIKHWALINELIRNDWPVAIPLQGDSVVLRFYLAAYLVPALVSKWSGWPATVATTAWFTLGYWLVFRLACETHARRAPPVVLAAMALPVLLAGADAWASHGLRAIAGTPATSWLGLHYESWFPGKPLQFASGLTNLAWAPHQSIPVFIVTAMILFDRGPRSLARTILAYGLLALWSPFGMIGLLPLMALRALPHLTFQGGRLLWGAILVGGSFAALVATYLSTNLPSGGVCLTCAVERLGEGDDLLIFLIVELAAFGLLLRSRLIADPFCAVSVVMLVVLFFVRGDTVDVMARGSMGPLLVLALRSTDETLRTTKSMTHALLIMLALLVALPTTISEMVYHATNGVAHRAADALLPPDRRWLSTFSPNADVSAADFFDLCGWRYESQYFTERRPAVLRSASGPSDLRP